MDCAIPPEGINTASSMPNSSATEASNRFKKESSWFWSKSPYTSNFSMPNASHSSTRSCKVSAGERSGWGSCKLLLQTVGDDAKAIDGFARKAATKNPSVLADDDKRRTPLACWDLMVRLSDISFFEILSSCYCAQHFKMGGDAIEVLQLIRVSKFYCFF